MPYWVGSVDNMSQKKRISAIIIVRNESVRIASCVANLSFADEIIVIDNGSTDTTPEIIKKLPVTVIKDNSRSFSDLRNTGAKNATGEWLLYVDADETVTSQLQKEIVSVVNKPSASAFFIPRQNYFLQTSWPRKDGMIRLIEKSKLVRWEGIIHEHPIINGDIKSLKQCFTHNTHRNLGEMVEKTNEWSEYEAQLRFSSDHPPVTWWRFFRVMMTEFFRYFIQDGGWKAGTVGLIESMYQSFSIFITYAKLWEMQEKQK